ncbi:OsmC family protein [Ilumatobacter sp.]|uniref:OsmC family protein n=1 Tax=Ilumatobacter sp. TaxID=1967498 RepID=UPI003AF9A31D
MPHNEAPDPKGTIMNTATTTTTTTTAPTERNGVPTDKLFGTIAKLKENGDLAAFRFSARNEWIEGTASRSTIFEWFGAGADQVHVDEYTFAADHPTLGHGHGPTPQEYVLHALAACITAGIATGAAARKIDLTSVSSKVTGEIDVRGVLGIDADIRRGFSSVAIEFDVQGDADRSVLDGLLAGATDYSAVYDMLTAATPVTVSSANG